MAIGEEDLVTDWMNWHGAQADTGSSRPSPSPSMKIPINLVWEIYGLQPCEVDFIMAEMNKPFNAYELEAYFDGMAAYFMGEPRFPEWLFEGSDSQAAFSNGWGLAESSNLSVKAIS